MTLLEKVDAGIAVFVERLNESGMTTVTSHSGLRADHFGRLTEPGYLAFECKHESVVRTAAAEVGLKTKAGRLAVTVYLPNNLPDDRIRKLWADFEVALLGGPPSELYPSSTLPEISMQFFDRALFAPNEPYEAAPVEETTDIEWPGWRLHAGRIELGPQPWEELPEEIKGSIIKARADLRADWTNLTRKRHW